MTSSDMRLAIALAVALTPFAAPALKLIVNGGGTTEILVGASNCKSLQLLAQWNLETAPTGSDSVRLIGVRSGSGACSSSDQTTAPDLTLVSPKKPSQQVETFSVPAHTMVLSTADAGVAGCDDPDVTSRRSSNPLTNALCVQYSVSGVFGGSAFTSASVNVKYALAKPLPPAAVTVTPGDGHLKIAWAKGDDAETISTFDVHVVPAGSVPDGGRAQNTTTTNADVDVTDSQKSLENDAGYVVTIVANDTYGNVSDPSAEVPATPVASSDFYDHYRDSGGSSLGGGGCSTGATSAWVAGIVLAISLALRRRRKARTGAALGAVLALLGAQAKADEPRPPRFLLGFKVDRYDPKVDSEAGLAGSTPYHDVFGPRAPPRYQLEFDWQVAHPFGSILLGATVGYWENYGKAILASSPPGSPQQSEDTAVLDVYPFGLIATYRFDWLASRWERFPLIPYAQFGFMRALWVSKNGRGNVTNASEGGRGSGWTHGYTTALGFAINLNAISPALAREAYYDVGIVRSLLFAEYGWTRLSNFGRTGALILSDHAWRFGFAVEF